MQHDIKDIKRQDENCNSRGWPGHRGQVWLPEEASMELGEATSVQFSSVQSLSLTLCDPTDCSKPGYPVHHQLPELAQTHVHRVSDAIQPSHPLSFPSLPASKPVPAAGSFPMSQFIASSGQSIRVSALASVLPMNIQDWFPLGWTVWISCNPGTQEPSPTPQFKSISSSALSFLYSPALTSIYDYWKNHSDRQGGLVCCNS